MHRLIIKPTRTVLSAIVLTGVFIFSAQIGHAKHEFLSQPIGKPVHYFEPVDIEGDGIWELALQVGDDAGDKIGVYSPRLCKWIDGPHRRPITANNWGCGNFDDDGQIEYAYTYGQSVHLFDPHAATDSAVLSVAYFPHLLQVWGQTSNTDPTILLYEHIADFNSECWDDVYTEVCHEWGEKSGHWHRHSISTGQYLDSRGGWQQRGRICFPINQPNLPFLCVYEHSRRFDMLAPHGYESVWFHNGILALDEGSNKAHDFTLPDFEPSDPWPPMWFDSWLPEVHHLALGDGEILCIWGSRYLEWDPGVWHLGGMFWWVEIEPAIAGLAVCDWDGQSGWELLLTFDDRELWEIRDPQTGNLIDSIQGMPPVDLRTAPIMEPNVLDLYYFKDSTLYILNRPDMPTGIFDEEEPISIPSAFTLQQNYPNPFNVSTVIAFNLDRPAPVTLEIFNLLGQKIATVVNGPLGTGVHRVNWDGTDRHGKAVVSGIYFYRLTAGEKTAAKKMVLLK